MNEMGGTNGLLKGDLKRRLVGETIALVNASGESPGDGINVQAQLRGLSSVLGVFVGVGGFKVLTNGTLVPLDAASWPAGAGTLQITPQTNFPDRGKVLYRPVFQDPTAVDHLNHPLPQGLPFSWNFAGECDEAVIDVVLNSTPWAGTNLNVQIVLQIMVEYFGPWWDAEAVRLAFGQVQVTPPGGVVRISSL